MCVAALRLFIWHVGAVLLYAFRYKYALYPFFFPHPAALNKPEKTNKDQDAPPQRSLGRFLCCVDRSSFSCASWGLKASRREPRIGINPVRTTALGMYQSILVHLLCADAYGVNVNSDDDINQFTN
jgi:hypothetical protein